MRRLLIALAVLIVAIVAIVLVTSGGDEPTGKTERGLPGFPLRGSLRHDTKAMEAAVAEWREEIAEDKGDEEDGDDDGKTPERRAIEARRPDPDDDITVVWIGQVDADGEQFAILQGRGLLAQVRRPSPERDWFLDDERYPLEQDTRGNLPLGVGEAVVVPRGTDWRFVNASYGQGYVEAGDGLYRNAGGINSDGFLLPQRSGADRVPVYATGIGARVVRRDAYERFTAALDDGYARAIWLAARNTSSTLEERSDEAFADDAPALSVTWTGEVPGQEHAAVVVQGDDAAPRLAVALGYGETPRPEDATQEEEGNSISFGSARTPDFIREPDTFAAGAYTAFDNVPYLILAGGGPVETVHALVGKEEVSRKTPLAVIDARRFAPNTEVDTVVFGRTASGYAVAPLQQR